MSEKIKISVDDAETRAIWAAAQRAAAEVARWPSWKRGGLPGTVVCDTCGREVPAAPGIEYVWNKPVAHVDERRGPKVSPDAVTTCREMEDAFYSETWSDGDDPRYWPEFDL